MRFEAPGLQIHPTWWRAIFQPKVAKCAGTASVCNQPFLYIMTIAKQLCMLFIINS